MCSSRAPYLTPSDTAFAEFLAERRAASEQVDWANVYQDFLRTFAPERRRAFGVYYTPAQVVQAQVRLVADLLDRRLGCRAAYADPRVVVVDPATGSGAYPLAVIADVQSRSGEVPRMFGQRLRLLESLPDAAAIARARLAAALGSGQAVQIDECDALEMSLALEAPVIVCLGNPPYLRGQAGPRSRLEDFQEPGAGVHAKNLYNAYVYFWRWALEQVFEERRGSGILSFVTPSSYLRGPGFGGMRRYLRSVLDELWILDLEGDNLAARPTDNVFPTRTPVAIAIGVRYTVGTSYTPAPVHYARLAGDRPEKLAALEQIQTFADVVWRTATPGWTVPFVSHRSSVYSSWPLLTEIFPWQVSGAQLKRTWPIAPTPALLRERWQRLLGLPPSERAATFKQTRDRDVDSTPSDLQAPYRRLEPLRTLAPDSACIPPVRYAYRTLDREWVLPDARLGDFMRPALWRIAGPRQVFLTSLLTNVLGRGPSAMATALVPDMDCFRGSFGARAVIPLWRDTLGECPNIAPGVLETLSAQYGMDVTPEQVLGYCYALLSTPAYQQRFENELRIPGPRMPMTADPELFVAATRLGLRLVWLHTYGQRCAPDTALAGSVAEGQARTLVQVGPDFPSAYWYDANDQSLHVGRGVFGPLPPATWTFSVSGLRVVPGWLERRVRSARSRRRSSPLDAIGLGAWTARLSHDLVELLWVIEASLAIQPVQDALLAQIVAGAQVAIGV